MPQVELKRRDGVAVITLENEEVRNGLTPELAAEWEKSAMRSTSTSRSARL